MTRHDLTGHVEAIQAQVARQLPEDEPDHVRRWVYETAVKVMDKRLREGIRQELAAAAAAAQERDAAQSPVDIARLAAFCAQTARDGVLPSLPWFEETAIALRAVAQARDTAPAALNHDGEPLHTGDDDRIDLVTSIIASAEQIQGEDDPDVADLVASILEDCRTLDALLIATIQREAALAQARDTVHPEKGADMFGIWVRESASREHAEWLRELPSKVDDGDVAVLAFTTRHEAEARAAKHFGYDTYDQMLADNWCEVRPLKARDTLHQTVHESCQCPAKPGEPCPLSEHDCAIRVRKAIATRYLPRAAELSNCAWKCATEHIADGFDACCPRCQQIALAMVDAMVDGRYLTLSERAAGHPGPLLAERGTTENRSQVCAVCQAIVTRIDASEK